METNKAIIVGLVFIIFLSLIGILLVPSGNKDDKAAEEEEIGGILDDAISTIHDSPDKPTPSEGEGSNDNTSQDVPDSLIRKRADEVSRLREDALARRSDTTHYSYGETTAVSSTSGGSSTTPTSGASATAPKGGHETAIQSALAKEQQQWQSTVNGLLSWANMNRTATESRVRAQQLREEADRIRQDAKTCCSDIPNPSSVRASMNRRASLMDELANRLSATSGNNAKMRIFIDDLKNRYNNINIASF